MGKDRKGNYADSNVDWDERLGRHQEDGSHEVEWTPPSERRAEEDDCTKKDIERKPGVRKWATDVELEQNKEHKNRSSSRILREGDIRGTKNELIRDDK